MAEPGRAGTRLPGTPDFGQDADTADDSHPAFTRLRWGHRRPLGTGRNDQSP